MAAARSGSIAAQVAARRASAADARRRRLSRRQPDCVRRRDGRLVQGRAQLLLELVGARLGVLGRRALAFQLRGEVADAAVALGDRLLLRGKGERPRGHAGGMRTGVPQRRERTTGNRVLRRRKDQPECEQRHNAEHYEDATGAAAALALTGDDHGEDPS